MHPKWSRHILTAFMMIAGCALMSVAQVSFAQDQQPTEYQVKAAYLYNLAKFVEWPEGMFNSPTAPMVFCIMGEDPFGNAFEAAKDRTISNRSIQIKRFASVKDMTPCHVLFISRSEKEKLPDILRELGAAPLLLVGDMEEFAQRGGMINLALRKETVTLEINIDALNRAGIKVTSRLLNAAHIVREKKRN